MANNPSFVLKVLLILTGVLALTASIEAEEGPQIHRYKDEEYIVFHDNRDYVSASDTCRRHSAYLVTIPDNSTQHFLQTILPNTSKEICGEIRYSAKYYDHTYWIGLSWSNESQAWQWPSGREVYWNNWQRGEPERKEYYSYLAGCDGYQWRATETKYRIHYICQRAVTSRGFSIIPVSVAAAGVLFFVLLVIGFIVICKNADMRKRRPPIQKQTQDSPKHTGHARDTINLTNEEYSHGNRTTIRSTADVQLNSEYEEIKELEMLPPRVPAPDPMLSCAEETQMFPGNTEYSALHEQNYLEPIKPSEYLSLHS